MMPQPRNQIAVEAVVSHRILLIEDEPGVVMALTDRLRGEGYLVESCADGQEGLRRAVSEAFHLIILDVMLPRKNGLDVCRELRETGLEVPVLMLTARGQVTDKVAGLTLGADDYLTKPFDIRELLARVEALLRRVPPKSSRTSESYRFGSVQVDFRRAEVFRGDTRLNLSAREFQLLHYLIDHRGDVVTREELLREVWGYGADVTTRTVDVHVAWLRQKVENNPKHPQFILTIRNAGYRFME